MGLLRDEVGGGIITSVDRDNDLFGELSEKSMKRLHIQIQPERAPELDVQAAAARLNELATESRVIDGFDKVDYVNVDLCSPDFPNLWKLVQVELASNAALRNATIVVCEGQSGWDDYLLLHHYDSAQPVERLK